MIFYNRNYLHLEWNDYACMHTVSLNDASLIDLLVLWLFEHTTIFMYINGRWKA